MAHTLQPSLFRLNEGESDADPELMPDPTKLQERTVSREEVETVLDLLRPAITADGGNVELVDVDASGTVRIAMQGACTDCPAQSATLRVGIEEPMRKALPGVSAVISI